MMGRIALRTFAVLIISLLLSLSASAQSFFADNSPASDRTAGDNGRGATENPLSYGGCWVTPSWAQGPMKVVSGAFTNTTTNTGSNIGSYSYWGCVPFKNDQWAFYVVGAMDGTAAQGDEGVHTRTQTGADTFDGTEILLKNSGGLPSVQEIFPTKLVSGTETALGSLLKTITTGNKVLLHERGVKLTTFQCATIAGTPCYPQAISIGSQTSGKAEMHVWDPNNIGSITMTYFAAGNLDPLVAATKSDAISTSLAANPNWIPVLGTFATVSGAQQGSTSNGETMAIYGPTYPFEFGPNQCAQTTIQNTAGTNNGQGPGVRMSGSSITPGVLSVPGTKGYILDSTPTQAYIFYVQIFDPTNGGNILTQLSTHVVNTTATDTWKICINGTSLTALQNGVADATLAVSDSTLADGNPGIFVYGSTATQNTFIASPN